MASGTSAAPVFVRLAAHPLRWRLLTELAGSDRRVRELVALVGEPQNLVSYHLRLLRDGGLVTTTRSTHDGRDTYYHLDLDRCANGLAGAGAALHPALGPLGLGLPAAGAPAPGPAAAGASALDLPAPGPAAARASAFDLPAPGPAAAGASALNLPALDLPALDLPAPGAPLVGPGPLPGAGVLFVCTGNSARSPIGEALLRHRSGGRVEVASAGTRPKPRIHRHAVRVLRDEFGIDIAGRRPRHVDALAGRRFDQVITLCDKARETCPQLPGDPRRMHWSVPDPAADDRAGRAGYATFRHAAADIDTRVRHLLPALAASSSVKEIQP